MFAFPILVKGIMGSIHVIFYNRPMFRRRCHLKIFLENSFSAVATILFDGAEPFVQFGRKTASASSALSHFWFPTNNFFRDASISFKVYRRVMHYKIHAKLDKRRLFAKF